MTTPTVRVLPLAPADGPHNMAADEALLASAEAGVASLRFYTWDEPTLSLGYFQPDALRRADPLLAGLAHVRRPSGGDAILHHREVTYCLALPGGRPWHDGESWLCRFHHAVAAALEDFEVRALSCPCGGEKKLGELLCFLHHTPGDLLIGESKIVGSAQRKRRGALMQHGSILLAQSPHTPALPGIRELAGVELSPEQVADAVLGELRQRSGWDFAPGGWDEVERGLIEELARAKYARAEWNGKR